jgi:hypothetical protein
MIFPILPILYAGRQEASEQAIMPVFSILYPLAIYTTHKITIKLIRFVFWP